MHLVQLSDQVFELAQRRAKLAGLASVDEYISSFLTESDAEDSGNFDHRFTPSVLAELDRVSETAKAGGKTFSSEEVDDYFRRKAETWRESPES
jgi:hypothetical protein